LAVKYAIYQRNQSNLQGFQFVFYSIYTCSCPVKINSAVAAFLLLHIFAFFQRLDCSSENEISSAAGTSNKRQEARHPSYIPVSGLHTPLVANYIAWCFAVSITGVFYVVCKLVMTCHLRGAVKMAVHSNFKSVQTEVKTIYMVWRNASSMVMKAGSWKAEAWFRLAAISSNCPSKPAGTSKAIIMAVKKEIIISINSILPQLFWIYQITF